MTPGGGRLKVAQVGLGLAAAAHYKGYDAHPAAEVVAVCDLDAGRARSFAAERGIERACHDYAALLREGGFDAVDITTPTFLHAPMALAAVRSGRHVMCEKPFCRSVAEGAEVCRAAAAAGVQVGVGETYVFTTAHVRARRLIDEGAIGAPLQVRQRHGDWIERPRPRVDTGPADRSWRVDPQGSGGGAYPWLFDHAVHFFAAAEYFVPQEPIEEVYAVAAAGAGGGGAAHDPYTGTGAEVPLITWKYAGGRAQGVWLRAERLNGRFDYMRGFSSAVVGEEGMVEVLGEGGANLDWRGEAAHLVLHRRGREPRLWRFDEGGDDVWESEISYYGQGHIAQVGHFVDSVLAGRAPRYGGEDGVRAVRCTLAAVRSVRSGLPVRVETVPETYTAYGGTEEEA